MLTIPYFQQENEYFCGPASLQMAAAFFDKKISQRDIAQQAGTNKEKGTDNDMLVKVATAAGFTVDKKEPATLQDITDYLNKNLPVIVNFIEPQDEEGHYAVVVDIDNENIILNDPWNGPNFKLSKSEFLTRWHSQSGQHYRWLMALTALNLSPR